MLHKYAAAPSHQLRSLAPHVFAVAAAAYRGACEQRRNQAIVISGESGSGKTETTKLVMLFLSEVASARAHAVGGAAALPTANELGVDAAAGGSPSGTADDGDAADGGDGGGGEGAVRWSGVEQDLLDASPLLEVRARAN